MNSRIHPFMGWINSPNIRSSQVRTGLETIGVMKKLYTHTTPEDWIIIMSYSYIYTTDIFELCANAVVMNKMAAYFKSLVN